MRIRSSMEQKTTLRRVIWLTSSVIILLSIGLMVFVNLSHPTIVLSAAPANGDYRSNGSGLWSNAAIWQIFGGGTWGPTATAPASGSKIVTIQSGNTITVAASITVDQVVVNSGGFLVNNSGITLTLANGGGTDLDVSGTFSNAGIVTINAGANIIFQNGGKYQHNFLYILYYSFISSR